MSPWATFYEGREGASYLEYVKMRYAPFIDAIKSRIKHDDLVLEIGAGTGTITRSLQWCGRKSRFAATDIEPEMVEKTKERLKEFGDVSVYRENALLGLNQTRADVVHSHGLLEHFCDEDIRTIIANYRLYSHAQVHYVPGLYDKPTFGDERLMSVDAWWKICKPSQIITFNDGLDYALVFE